MHIFGHSGNGHSVIITENGQKTPKNGTRGTYKMDYNRRARGVILLVHYFFTITANLTIFPIFGGTHFDP